MENTIGQRLREYRIQNHMTQEKVADAIGISSQAVSKWENGTTLPDISVIVPLAILFHVTTDAILGNTERRDYWERKWQVVSAKGTREALCISEKALAEMPNDKMFLYRRACCEFFTATESDEPSERECLLWDAVRHFSELNTAYPDFEAAISMYVRALSMSGRFEEAKSYAKSSSDSDRLLASTLAGTELSAQRKIIINKSAQNLLADLLRDNSSESLQAADFVTSGMALMFGDKAYCNFRLAVFYHRALKLVDDGKYPEAIGTLREAFSYLVSLGDCQEQGTEWLSKNDGFSFAFTWEQYKQCLQNEKFNSLQGKPEYSILLNNIEEYEKNIG